MKYQGGCHCGNIRFEVDGDLQQVMECDCSICSKRGALHWFVPRTKLNLLTPETNLSTYTFNKHIIKHRFCAICACAPFGEAVNPKTGEPTAAVNARCIEGAPLSELKVTPFNGRDI